MKLAAPRGLSALVAILALGAACPRLLAQSASQETPQSVYSQDCYGLEKEIQPYLNAYTASDPAIDDTLSILVVPEAESFFGSHFPQDSIQQLVDDQKTAIAKFKQRTSEVLIRSPKGTRFLVSCKKYSPTTSSTLVEPRSDAIRPIVGFEVEQYQLTFVADADSPQGGRMFSKLDNFVYLEGAFRYVGGGGYPFWLMPDLAARPEAAPAPSISPTVQSAYADSSAGLKRLMEDGLKLAKENDQKKLTALVDSMVVPDPAAYFSRVFGPEIGGAHTRTYGLQISVIPGNAIHFFQDAVKQQFTSVDVIRFTNACDVRADEKEYPVLLSRQGQEPLSKVTFSRGNSSSFLRYLAYIDGGFRFLGNLQAIPYPGFAPSTPLASSSGNAAAIPPSRIKVGSDSLRDKLIKQVQPVYPEDARQHLFEGQVSLHVLISPNGAPTDFQVIEGRCSLAKAAIDAVRQWRFSPTLRDGTAVEVETDISLNFSLHQ
jgi:TonB family protein